MSEVLDKLYEEVKGMMATNYAWNDAIYEVLYVIDRVRKEADDVVDYSKDKG